MPKDTESNDQELKALGLVNAALKGLDRDSQQRVLDYITRKLGLSVQDRSARSSEAASSFSSAGSTEASAALSNERNDEFDGISPIAIKWIRRNDLTPDRLGKLFSLGADEIDLVAKSVPGNSKPARTRSVALLKAIATYLSTGAPRVSSDQIKEACLHYDAFDRTNHAKYLKAISSELSGNKESGFTLTARGLTEATEMIKGLINEKN